MSNNAETEDWPTTGRHRALCDAFENRPCPGRCGVDGRFCTSRSRGGPHDSSRIDHHNDHDSAHHDGADHDSADHDRDTRGDHDHGGDDTLDDDGTR